MQLKEKLQQQILLFEQGNFTTQDEFFDTILENMTLIAHAKEIKQLIDNLYEAALADKNVNRRFLELITFSHGSIEFLADNYEIAKNQLNKAQELFAESKDEDGVAAAKIVIGFLYRSTGEIDIALKYGLEGIEQLANKPVFKMMQIMAYYWIGGLYTETGHLDEALRLLHLGLKVNYPKGIELMGARLTNAIAGVYMKQKNFTLALEYYQQSLESFSETTEPTFRARGLTDLADYYTRMGNYELAIDYNKQALDIRQQMNIQNGSITNLMNLGNIYSKQNEPLLAVDVLTQALKLAEEIKVKVKIYQIHELLSDIYLGMGRMADSLLHFRAFHEIRDDVNHEDMDRKVKNQVKLFEAQQTQKENAIIKSQKIEIENKNIELQETIDELTLARISKKAKALTLSLALVLFIFQDKILEMILHMFASENYFLSMAIKIAIIFSLDPVNKAIEKYMLHKVIKKDRKEVLV